MKRDMFSSCFAERNAEVGDVLNFWSQLPKGWVSWQWCVLPQAPQGCVLAPRGVCSLRMGQNRTGHTSELPFGQWLTCRSVCRGACPLLCLHPDFHTLPTFRSVRQPGQAKDFVCLCSSSLPFAHPWPGHSCFPYPWPHVAFSILWHLAEATF